MSRTKIITGIAILAMLLSIALVAFAQGGPGRGQARGQGPGVGRGGQCRMGQGAGMQNGQCRMGQGSGMRAGWWTWAKAQTPEQQAFINQIKGLQDQISDQQIELVRLQNTKAPQPAIAKVQGQLDGLRDQVHALMIEKTALLNQLGVPAYGIKGTNPNGCQYMMNGQCPGMGGGCRAMGGNGNGARRANGTCPMVQPNAPQGK